MGEMFGAVDISRSDLMEKYGENPETDRGRKSLTATVFEGEVQVRITLGDDISTMISLPPYAAIEAASDILYQAQQIQQRPESLWLFENGNVMAFSENGRQINDLQQGYRKTCAWVEEHSPNGITFYFAKWDGEMEDTGWASWGDEGVAGEHVLPEFHNNWLRRADGG